MKQWILLLMLGALASAQSSPPPADSSPETNDKLIQRLVSDFEEAWNKHDAHAFAETFAEDADFNNIFGVGDHGRHAIEQFHATRFQTMFKQSHQTATDIRTRYITPSIASVDIRWEMTGALAPDGTPIPLRSGLLNWLVTKQNGKWLITVMHNQELTPAKK
jgi:uncharacterized protein (TIGR02246 family)